MTPKEYIENVKKTESMDWQQIITRLANISTIRLDHAADGLVTEAGEFKDTLKKYKYYGKPIDGANLVEELGDILWYLAMACDELSISLEDVMKVNIIKLKSRYKDKFNETEALNRDLENERVILEGGIKNGNN